MHEHFTEFWPPLVCKWFPLVISPPTNTSFAIMLVEIKSDQGHPWDEMFDKYMDIIFVLTNTRKSIYFTYLVSMCFSKVSLLPGSTILPHPREQMKKWQTKFTWLVALFSKHLLSLTFIMDWRVGWYIWFCVTTTYINAGETEIRNAQKLIKRIIINHTILIIRCSK